MGIAPVTYDKTPGDHTITLRKSGYITRSYSINIADDDKDVTYSFPDLDPESSNNTVSGNTVSGNTANEDKNKNEDRKDSSKDHGSTGNTGNQGNSGSQGSTGSNDNTGGSGNSGAEEGDHDNTVSGNTISGNTLDEDSDA